ncbi:MAG: RdgB/HAM1 family non-canonical purine NTP pyrophosphatase [Terriglobales bacterium]
MRRIFIATSSAGKLRDFAAAAADVEVAGLPGFDSLPPTTEDGDTFEENARKKAEHYSRLAPGELVLADDSGLEADALGGLPGVRSARYAADEAGELASSMSADEANNARLLRALDTVPDEARGARFVCVIAAARDGRTLASFRGEAAGVIARAPRGAGGFGYDPLFFFPPLDKTFAELAPKEKAAVSHRGAAFRKFLEWFRLTAER